MSLIRRVLRRYDARSMATLISTGGVIPLPVISVLAPETLYPGGMPILLTIWSFIAVVFAVTAIRARLTDLEFAFLGGLGIVGICGTSMILASPRSSTLVLAIVAVIPAIGAISATTRLILSHLALAVVCAATVLAVTTPSLPEYLISFGAMLGLIVVPVFLVVALRKSMEAVLDQQTRLVGIDPLTGLLNRRGFLIRASQLLSAARSSTGWIGILLLDVDHFKKINDQYGHLAGDGVLLAASAAIREHAPVGSEVCRYGGEEFLMFHVVHDADELWLSAERLRAAVAAAAPVTISVGGVCAPLRVAGDPLVSGRFDTAYSTDDVIGNLLGQADACVYQAKENGRDTTVIKSIDAVTWNDGAPSAHAADAERTVSPPSASLYEVFYRRPADFVDIDSRTSGR
ncbi:GGDEF domain-containing protein [Gordonia hongkongensis]|uniref:GGDEF domain-containing protein n=2 Tax=Gordonia TaxID=2053 RepID=A0AAX3TA02_9ACTN|nr:MULTISPECIES: GGDEF domain-containing protein [Gordonia]MDF6099685.1 GGDEF domain-containing protein [Gordonia hongkongensis]UCZ89324.1 GGDEF domain-containing protein [Gordonia sp. WA4-43]UPG69229.1 GGDEF domain-containing protein [Gordonia hongkongensis]WFP25827.1 GGDEF domain-containing protein [Gordonia hongkongensis]